MAKITVDSSSIKDVLVRELQEYCQDVTDSLKAEVKKVAKETVAEIKENAPKDKGEYAKSWRSDVVFENDFDIRVSVHAGGQQYRLAHLLEFGHELVRKGKVYGPVNGKPHIRPAEEHAAEKLLYRVKTRIKNG